MGARWGATGPDRGAGCGARWKQGQMRNRVGGADVSRARKGQGVGPHESGGQMRGWRGGVRWEWKPDGGWG